MSTKWHKNAQNFHKEIVKEYQFSADEAEVLAAAIESLSNYWHASDLLRSDGLVVKTEAGMIRKHPAAEISKNSWAQFLAGCRHLGICVPEKEARRSYTKGGA